MAPLKRLLAPAALAFASPAAASPLDQWRPLIGEASLRFGVPEEWIVRVMRAESGGRTHLGGRRITSHAGAMGLMQVMPGTYSALARQHGLGPDPYQPRDNILAGTAYLRAMYDRYGYPGLFAAYNAGPGRYEQHLNRGRALPAETRAYVAAVAPAPAVITRAVQPGELNRSPPGGGLFFALGQAGGQAAGEAASRASDARPSGLFVKLGRGGGAWR